MKKRRIILIAGIVVVGIAAAFIVRDYLMFRPNDWVEGDVSKWEKRFPNNSAYEMGLNSEGDPMFKKPLDALEQFKTDYEGFLNQTAEEYDLKPFSKYNYGKYMMTDPGNIIWLFGDIFSNSVSDDDYIW